MSLFAVEDLHVNYGQSEIIHGMSLEAQEGEILALMGLNGMGKTTFMKAAMGIVPTKGGSVKLGGQELTGKAPFQRVAAGLAYVPQGRQVFSTLTVEENIKTGLRSDREDVPDDLYEMFPVLKEMRHRRAGNLSGGQQQQLVIARALAAKPKVLLLDEPTEGIQPSIIKELAVVLREIREKKRLTILVSEQVLSFALAAADRVMVVNKGKIIHESKREDTDEAVMKQLLSI
ncbi:MAG TPA: urea ABC transporter ATP-binding subunit UrtE [Polyangiales bacterium]|nr:urea ABC transporter ATP-binding subunit UrtE [Polyangiales bacterium]